MLIKSNVNFTEMLFSIEVEDYDGLYPILYEKREEIARMNLPYLYDACLGMYFRVYKLFDRDRKLIEQDGFSKEIRKKLNKHAMSSYRILDFLFRYKENHFESFQEAIRYDSNRSEDKEKLAFFFGLLDSKYSIEEMDEILLKKLNDALKLESIYEVPQDLKMQQFVKDTVMEHVRQAMINSFSEENI